MEPRRSKHFLAHIPTIALLVVFAMSAPLGVLFFILRAIDRDAEKKEQENAEYSSDFRPQDTGAGQPARDTEPVYGHDVPTAERSMDLLITAFENQLDKLFASDALDVSTDIAALEGMLNLDGLTGGDFAPRS